MSGPSSSGLKPPSVFSGVRSTGARPKSKFTRLTSPRSSPKRQQSLTAAASEQASSPSANKCSSTSTSPSRILSGQSAESTSPARSSKSSPRRYGQSDDFSKQHFSKQSPSPKRSPRRLQDHRALIGCLEEDFSQDEMGFGFDDPSSGSLVDEPSMSFLEFESLYTLEKELGQSRRETIAELDEKCIFGGWFGTRRGVYTELPDPSARNTEFVGRGANGNPIGACSLITFNATSGVGSAIGASQIPTEGFSFAPGWALNAEHYYQWQHRGKSTQQVLDCFVCFFFVLFLDFSKVR